MTDINMVRKSTYKRDMQYEFIRVVAMFFVIAVHVIGNMPTDTPMRKTLYQMGTLLFYTCNGLFFFVSGKFAIESRAGNIEYYKKKICNIIFPMLFYMFIKHVYMVKVLNYNDNSFFMNIMGDFAQTDYWFLYILMGNLFLVPILRKAFVESDGKELCVFIVLGIVHCALITYLPYFGVSCQWAFPLGGWMFYFYLGYCLERVVNSRKKEQLVIFFGGGGFLISCVQKYYGWLNNIHDMAPTYIAITCGMYWLLKKLYNKCFDRRLFNGFIKFCGKHSFAVYMLHSMILTTVMRSFPFKEWYVPYLIGITCIVAFLSLVLGCFCDHVLELVLRKSVRKFLYKT